MALAWTISCTRCRFRQLACLDSHCIRYRLGEDRLAPMPYAAAWCESCRKVTLAEEVPDAATLRDRAESLLQHKLALGCGPGHKFYERLRAEFANQIVWRSRRIGPPKCLLCRSPSVSLFDLSGRPPLERQHPGCPGRLKFELRGDHFHTRCMLLYSVEGEFLGSDSPIRAFQAPARPLAPSESFLWCWVDVGRNKPAGADRAPD